jgi:hypothetical protein
MNCDRCGRETSVHVMSMFNTEEICMDCKAEEKMRPDYKDAVETDNAPFERATTTSPEWACAKMRPSRAAAWLSQ